MEFSFKHSYDYKDSRYSAWAESVWKEVGGRMFLKASPSLEHFSFALGVLVTLLSFLVVYWVERNSAAIFSLDASPTTPSPPTSSSSAAAATQAVAL